MSTKNSSQVPSKVLGKKLGWSINTDPSNFGPGVWFSTMCDALRSRTDPDITSFIETKVTLLTALLCSTCSNEAYKLIVARHPEDYRYIKDNRGERIGMFLWVFDLHNDVNNRLKKPQLSLDVVQQIYAPLYYLTTSEIEAEKRYSLTPEGMKNLYAIDFNSGDTNESISLKKEVRPEAAELRQHAPRPKVQPEIIPPPEQASPKEEVEAEPEPATNEEIINQINQAERSAMLFRTEQLKRRQMNIRNKLAAANQMIEEKVKSSVAQVQLPGAQVQLPGAQVQSSPPVAQVQLPGAQVQSPPPVLRVQSSPPVVQVQSPPPVAQVQSSGAQIQSPLPVAQVQSPLPVAQVQSPGAQVQSDGSFRGPTGGVPTKSQGRTVPQNQPVNVALAGKHASGISGRPAFFRGPRVFGRNTAVNGRPNVNVGVPGAQQPNCPTCKKTIVK